MNWSNGWEPYTLLDPEKAERPAPPRLCGFLYDGRRHSMSGEPESAKSLLSRIVALEFLRATPEGKDWRDGVAIIDFEGSREMESNMLAELGATFEEVQRINYFQPTAAPTEQDVYTIAEDLNTGLVIIDSAIGAYDASDLDDQGRKDTERMGRLWVKPFFEYGVTTLLLDHVVKDSKNRGRWAIGSERKLGKTDIALGVDTITPISRGTTGLYKVVAGKDRGGYMKRGTTVADLQLTSDPQTHRVTWEFRSAPSGDTNTFRPTILMDRVRNYLELQAEPVSKTQVVQETPGKRQFLFQAIGFLILDGEVREDGSSKKLVLTSKFPVPEQFPNGSQNHSGDPVPGSSPSKGGTGTEPVDAVNR